jgi:hypothetical protein
MHAECAQKFSMHAEHTVKIFWRMLSLRLQTMIFGILKSKKYPKGRNLKNRFGGKFIG